MDDPTDPRAPQKRLAVSSSGRAVWVEISGDDRLKIVKSLPSRWPDVITARERGETLEQIARWAKAPPPCRPSCRLHNSASASDLIEGVERGQMAEHQHVGEPCLAWLIAECYNFIETQINDLAARRARLMV